MNIAPQRPTIASNTPASDGVRNAAVGCAVPRSGAQCRGRVRSAGLGPRSGRGMLGG